MRLSLRRLLLFVALVGIAFGIYRWLPNGLTYRERDNIKHGMSKDEVILLVGRPDNEMNLSKGRTYWSYGWGLAAYPMVFDANGKIVEVSNEVFADF